MVEFGIDVAGFENSGALHLMDFNDWYFFEGKFSISKTMELWRKLYDESLTKGFNGLRVTGEMTCFFENKMVNELLVYERSLHRVLELPMRAICAYNSELVAKQARAELLLDVIKAHSIAIILGPEGGIVKSY